MRSCPHNYTFGTCSECRPTTTPQTAVAARSEHETLTAEIADRFADAVRDGVLQELFGNLAAEIIQLRGAPFDMEKEIVKDAANNGRLQDFGQAIADLETLGNRLVHIREKMIEAGSGRNGSA